MRPRFKLLSLIVGTLLFSGGLPPLTLAGTVTAQAQTNQAQQNEAERIFNL